MRDSIAKGILTDAIGNTNCLAQGIFTDCLTQVILTDDLNQGKIEDCLAERLLHTSFPRRYL